MISFNLLPYRDDLRKKRKQDFLSSIVLSLLVGIVLAVPTNFVLDYVLVEQQTKITILTNEIAIVDKKIIEVADFENEIIALESRKKAVENLQSERNQPTRIFSELAQLVPEGVYLTAMNQQGSIINLTGLASSNQRISELLKIFGNKSEWLDSPELIEIVATGGDQGTSDQRTLVQFKMTVKEKTKVASNGAGGSTNLAKKVD